MSPKSRGRTKAPKARRDSRRPDRSRVDDGPELAGIFQQVLRDAGTSLAALDDPLQAEMLVSEVTGIWSRAFLVDADPEVVFGEGLIEHAARRSSPAALAILRGLAALGTDRQRTRAATAAAELAARGVAEPSWASRLEEPTLTGCWAYRDVYGDQTSVLLAFERRGERHGLVLLVDHTLGGIAKDAFLIGDPDGVLAEVRRQADGQLMTLREITPGEARGILEPAFEVTEHTLDPPLGEDFQATRALALARIRLLPQPELPAGPVQPPAGAEEVSESERDRIVTQFLASPPAAELGDAAVARRCAGRIVDFGCDCDEGQPLRVSPAKTEIFLLGWLPRKAVLDDAEQQAMPAVVRAWVRWAGERAGLPEAARAELDEAAVELGEQFPDAFGDPERAGPGKRMPESFAGDLSDLVDPSELQQVLDRRMFAMPYFGTRIGDEDYPELDPGDEDERRLLIIGEHPEYHDTLDGPASEELVDGVNPRLHVAAHEIVAAQLWNDEPPEVWRAAQRFLAQGVERHDELCEWLGERFGPAAFDRDAVSARLARLRLG